MRVKAALLAGICATVVAFPAQAQDTSPDDRDGPVESGKHGPPSSESFVHASMPLRVGRPTAEIEVIVAPRGSTRT